MDIFFYLCKSIEIVWRLTSDNDFIFLFKEFFSVFICLFYFVKFEHGSSCEFTKLASMLVSFLGSIFSLLLFLFFSKKEDKTDKEPL